ncbi:MAG: GNAT family N-acetyltransferase [Gemmatimonadales bacterium]
MVLVVRTTIETVLPLRDRYRDAMAAQIVHDSWHRRGFTTLFRLEEDGRILGYAAVGGPPGDPQDTIKEFFLNPEARHRADECFAAVLAAGEPRYLEAQTNDPFLSPLLARFAPDHRVTAHLFAAGTPTALPAPGVTLRPVTGPDRETVFAHSTEPVGDWGLERDGRLVATGGLFFHYNPPFGDIYMEVEPGSRGQGLASYLVQELKRIGAEGGHVPAARCNPENRASRGALERAGMVHCGDIVRGPVVAR